MTPLRPKPRTVRVDRALWELLAKLVTTLAENPNHETLSYFQGYAESLSKDIAEKGPTAPPSDTTRTQ